MTQIPAEQYRIDRVQVLNWGGYRGLQTMHAGRTSTAILGPSGRGKSTLLDAIASVIMPNPQEFNQAARDDKGRKRERTVYTYARGLTVNHQDDNRRSSTPSYLRPPGSSGFPTGTAVTWATGNGQMVTAFRLAWVASDATDNEAVGNTTVYGFTRDFFDLATLDGLEPSRAGSAPISVSSLGQLIDTGRGDIVDRSQGAVHAKMRRQMRMGDTEESQRLAMQLLRRAQASKGIFSINDLFKEFVLTEPKALSRWDVTVEQYMEASRLYDEFELARRKADTLRDLPGAAERYRTAGNDATNKRLILREPDGDGVARLRVWHAEKTLEWATRTEEDVRLDQAVAREKLQAAEADERDASREQERALAAMTDAGDDRSALVRDRIIAAEEDHAVVSRHRADVKSRLKAFGQQLPTSDGDLLLLKQAMTGQHSAMLDEHETMSGDYERKAGERARLGELIVAQRGELERAAKSRSNIPPEDDKRRRYIAEGCNLPVERLPFVGELLDIAPEHRGWERAITSIVRPLAQDLVVSERDFPAVRAWVNSHNTGGHITLAPARTDQPVRSHPAGTVPAMLTNDAGRYEGWISSQLARFAYECVERDTDLDGPLPAGVVGRVTRSGMRTAREGRVTKNDATGFYRWIGRDNQQLQADLHEQLRATQQAYDDAQRRTRMARDTVQEHQTQMEALVRLRNELNWPDLDLDAVERRLAALNTELEDLDTPENKERRRRLKAAQEAFVAARIAGDQIRHDIENLEVVWGAAAFVQDTCRDILSGNAPITEEERATTATVPYTPPDLGTVDHGSNQVDAMIEARVQASYRDAANRLDAQIDTHDEQRATYEQMLLNILRAYRNINDRTARDIDYNIAAVPALEAIRDRLVTDDLPRARHDWLIKVDADLNQGLRNLLSQIDADARDITRGLAPINRVLANVPFRQSSHLAIEPIDQPNSDLRDFRNVVLQFTRENPLGEDLLQDDTKVEASFVKLRTSIARLTDASRAGDSWRRRVFDAREHVEFRAVETAPDTKPIVHDGVAGMSGGEGQELIAFILGAALRYRLGEGGETVPLYGTVVLDEGFVKADSDYTGRALQALQALGFQLLIGAPREKATAFEDFVDLVAYINKDPVAPDAVRIYSMTIAEALRLDDDTA